MIENVNFGDIFYADLGRTVGSEQGGIRPVVCVQCRVLNDTSPTVVIIPITSKAKPTLMTHVYLPKGTGGLIHDSCVMAEQIRTIDKSRLKKHVGVMPAYEMTGIVRCTHNLIRDKQRKHRVRK